MKNLLSPAVNKSDLRRLNYNKTVSAGALPWTPLEELKMFSQSQMGRGTSSAFSFPRLVRLLNWYHTFYTKVTPLILTLITILVINIIDITCSCR